MAKILVVDDNPVNRKLVVALLGHEGHQIFEANDGADGLEAARAGNPDLVISDILMPSMDGFEFVRRLRADPRLHDVSVIFYTAHYHETEARNLARACRVSRVIVKAAGASGIVRAVSEVLAGDTEADSRLVDDGFDREHLQVITNKLAQKANQLKVANARFAALTDLNVQLASEREPRVLFEKVCRSARNLLGAKYSVLAVAGMGTDVIHANNGVDVSADTAPGPQVERGLLGRVAAERRPWRVSSANGPIDAGLPSCYPPARAFLAAPVVSLTQTFGWLCLADKVGAAEFTAEDELILSVLGAQSGRIYENSRLYLEVQHHAAELQVEIDERARAISELESSEERFRELAENIQDAFFVIAGDLSRTLYMSPAYAQIWGRPWTQIHQPLPWADSVHAQDAERIRLETAQDSRGMAAKREFEFRILRPSGEIRWISARTYPIVADGGRISRVVGVATDITQRKQSEAKIEHLNRVHGVLSGINSVIVRVADRSELFWEACRLAVEYGRFRMAWCSWLDPQTSQITPVAWAGDGPDLAEALACKLEAVADGESLLPAAMRRQQPIVCDDLQNDSQLVPCAQQMLERGYRAIVALPLVIDAESVGCLVLVMDQSGFFDAAEMRLLTELSGDISFALDHIKKSERLNYLAYYDASTGLANRTFFHERLAQYVAAAVRGQQKFALVIADMERFETINDTFGRHAGDGLLRQLGERLTTCVGDASEVARLGADQFAAVIFDVGDVSEVVHTIDRWRQQWLGAPFTVEGSEVRMSAKTGVALYPADGTDPVTLIRNAEAALKNAKTTGDRLLFYAPYLSDRAAEALALENQLKRAIELEQFVLHYQPKVDMEARRLEGVEALIRWQHPDLGLVPPMKFIPLLEETGMIIEVGTWALRQASLDRTLWRERRLNVPRIAVNVSTVQLQRSDFVRTVATVLKMSGDDSGLDIEVTESLIMNDPDGNIAKLRAVRDLGVRIAIDDFGTGYSSLAYLTRLPAHTLKIDRSFVISMLDDPGAMTLVSTIISLAHSLKLQVVAEGVESEEQAKFLRLLRCDQMQGYLISKPLSCEDLITYFARNRG
jgi:diguanylate cyclase (GGDEF)-like protein/PAS domain S-box-containing protein